LYVDCAFIREPKQIILIGKAIYQVRLSIAGYNLIDTLFKNKTPLVATNYTHPINLITLLKFKTNTAFQGIAGQARNDRSHKPQGSAEAPASPINFLFVTKIEIILSFYSNFPHFAYTTKLGLAPYLLRTCSVHTPLDILLFSFPPMIALHKAKERN